MFDKNSKPKERDSYIRNVQETKQMAEKKAHFHHDQMDVGPKMTPEDHHHVEKTVPAHMPEHPKE